LISPTDNLTGGLHLRPPCILWLDAEAKTSRAEVSDTLSDVEWWT